MVALGFVEITASIVPVLRISFIVPPLLNIPYALINPVLLLPTVAEMEPALEIVVIVPLLLKMAVLSIMIVLPVVLIDVINPPRLLTIVPIVRPLLKMALGSENVVSVDVAVIVPEFVMDALSDPLASIAYAPELLELTPQVWLTGLEITDPVGQLANCADALKDQNSKLVMPIKKTLTTRLERKKLDMNRVSITPSKN